MLKQRGRSQVCSRCSSFDSLRRTGPSIHDCVRGSCHRSQGDGHVSTLRLVCDNRDEIAME